MRPEEMPWWTGPLLKWWASRGQPEIDARGRLIDQLHDEAQGQANARDFSREVRQFGPMGTNMVKPKDAPIDAINLTPPQGPPPEPGSPLRNPNARPPEPPDEAPDVEAIARKIVGELMGQQQPAQPAQAQAPAKAGFRQPSGDEMRGMKRFGKGYASTVGRAKDEQAQRRFRMDKKKSGLVPALMGFQRAGRENKEDASMRQSWMDDPGVAAQLNPPNFSNMLNPVMNMLRGAFGGFAPQRQPVPQGAMQAVAGGRPSHLIDESQIPIGVPQQPMSPGAPMEQPYEPGLALDMLRRQLSGLPVQGPPRPRMPSPPLQSFNDYMTWAALNGG